MYNPKNPNKMTNYLSKLAVAAGIATTLLAGKYDTAQAQTKKTPTTYNEVLDLPEMQRNGGLRPVFVGGREHQDLIKEIRAVDKYRGKDGVYRFHPENDIGIRQDSDGTLLINYLRNAKNDGAVLDKYSTQFVFTINTGKGGDRSIVFHKGIDASTVTPADLGVKSWSEINKLEIQARHGGRYGETLASWKLNTDKFIQYTNKIPEGYIPKGEPLPELKEPLSPEQVIAERKAAEEALKRIHEQERMLEARVQDDLSQPERKPTQDLSKTRYGVGALGMFSTTLGNGVGLELIIDPANRLTYTIGGVFTTSKQTGTDTIKQETPMGYSLDEVKKNLDGTGYGLTASVSYQFENGFSIGPRTTVTTHKLEGDSEKTRIGIFDKAGYLVNPGNPDVKTNKKIEESTTNFAAGLEIGQQITDNARLNASAGYSLGDEKGIVATVGFQIKF